MLQILKLEDDTMPKGLTRDYPKYSVPVSYTHLAGYTVLRKKKINN